MWAAGASTARARAFSAGYRVRGNLTIFGYLLIVLGIMGIAALLIVGVIFLASLAISTVIFFALLIGLGVIGVIAYRDWHQSSYASFRDWYDAQRQWTQGIVLVAPLAPLTPSSSRCSTANEGVKQGLGRPSRPEWLEHSLARSSLPAATTARHPRPVPAARLFAVVRNGMP
jgi:hypothetical protein